MRRSAMTDEERAQQNEKRQIEYKRRRDSMSNDELTREKKIRHERYVQRRCGRCTDSVRLNNATNISEVFGGQLIQVVVMWTEMDYLTCRVLHMREFSYPAMLGTKELLHEMDG